MAAPPRDPKGVILSVGFVLVLYWQAVSGTGFFFQRDVWLYWIPYIEWAVRTLDSGRLPQWNPFVGFGAPYLADPSFQFFYPPAILNWILPARAAYTILVVGHSIFGSIGVFRLLRLRLRSSSAALIGAITFIASGPVVSSANLWHHVSSVAYMPWVLDAFLRLRAGRGSVRRLGFLTGLQALAGSADVCAMTGAGLILLLPLRGVRLRKFAPKLAAALILCLMLAAVQWVPAGILAAQTSRASLSLQTRLHWSVSPSALIDFVIPLNGAAHAAPSEPDYLEERLRFIPWMYMGASTLPLLLLGARAAPRAALLLLFSILLSTGRHTPLAEWAGHLPLISTFRFPAKVLWFVAGCWATLAAIGFGVLRRGREEIHLPGILTGGALVSFAAALFIRSPFSATDHEDWRHIAEALPWAPLALGGALVAASFGRAGRAAVVFVVAADLVGAGQTYNAYASRELFTTQPAMVGELKRLNASRIFVFQKSRSEVQWWKAPPSWSAEEAYLFGQGQFLLPPQSTRWSIRGSFDGDFTGLARPEYSALSAVVTGSEEMSPRLLQIAGVTHALRFRGLSPPEFEVVAEVPTFHDRPVLVLRVPDPRPRAYVVHEVRTEGSWAEAVEALSDPEFDPAREIVRMGGAPRARASTGEALERSWARLEEESDGRMRVRARLFAPGTVVVQNGFSAGWTARADGRPAPLLPANLLFLSIDLEPGDHVIEFEYRTPGLALGFGLSALSWMYIALGVSGVFLRRRRA